MEDENFLEAAEAEDTNAPVEDPKPAPPAEVTQEPVQSAPAEVAPVDPAPAEPPVTPEAPKHPDPGFVPIGVVLDTRDKLKAAEARLAQYERQQQVAQQQVQMPDPYAEPEEYARVQEARVQQALYQTNLQWSERIASIQHGPEIVAEAKTWGVSRCDADPYFNAKVAASPDPIGFVVSEYQREQIASQVKPAEFAEFQAWKAAQSQVQQQQAAPAAPPNPSAAIPPRSLASAPSAGGVLTEVPMSDEDMFKADIPLRP